MKKLRTIKAMRDFLKNHKRYATMNTWNVPSSFARCVKLHTLPNCPREAYNFLECEDAFEDVRSLIHDFTVAHGHEYTIGFNGRSSGYMVLYSCRLTETAYKSVCRFCGQRNFEAVSESPASDKQSAKCGHCGKYGRINYTKPPTRLDTSSESIGDNIDELSSSGIRSLYAVVYDFNKTVDACIEAFLDYVRTHDLKEETVYVPKTIVVPVEKSAVTA